ncbi:putative LRR receptor-like serine/threonine-protein kinase [Panicum miliaceum]|uniref:Receptor kinase-like protein Xa21 n=1 Tax=Panicum miliaceum TaxID=4540 RepID=A0A3L6PHP5_PANMI|nr:putative LRR receptor-like serine/threonine-protein kinase [Panicum miliaceum]
MPHIEIHNASILPLLAFIFFHSLALCPNVQPLRASPGGLNELDALLCLKSRIHDPSGALASWRDDSLAFCDWHGVTCGRKQHTSRVMALDLESENITGNIFPCVANLSFITRIHMPNNQLNGHISPDIGQLTRLRLQGQIPESFGNLTSLKALNLNYNNLSGTVPPALYNISSLAFLGLGANQLVGRLPTDIGSTLSSITTLTLEGNHFEGPIPASLANASNLHVLNLRSNAFAGVIPSLGTLTKLRNNLQGTISTYITNLSKSLKVLVLIENELTGAVPSEIGYFMNLTVLQVDNNLLSGYVPDMLGNLQNLSILTLSRNKLSGEIPPSIGKLERLTELHFEENVLAGPIPSSLGGCKHLTTLNLSSNSLYGGIPQELFSISTLSEGLDLSYNQLTGDIPLEIGRLINLESLCLSNNQLSGEIPSTLGHCLILSSLHLEANFLQGSIPNSFISLQGITEMDLSQNNLSGRIPEYFESFTSLKVLNLSYNDLEGPVPRGGMFANLSDVLIKGNRKLCATSSILHLPPCRTSPHKRRNTKYIVAVVVPFATIVAVTMACIAFITLKKRREAKRLTDQSLKQFKNVSYTDLFNATDGFSPSSLVGSGSFGMVYKGQLKFEICEVAIKVFRLDQLEAPSNFLSECEALRNIRHRNLIRVISVCSTFDPTGNEFKALILEYKANGNLESWLHPKEHRQSQKRLLNFGSRITIAVDIAAALDYLHNRCTPPLVHRDLKPSNVLLSDEMVACLSDFGLAKILSGDTSTLFGNSTSIAGPKGSVGYIAPEYAMGCQVSVEGDIYSYGIILLEMMAGKRPTDEMFKDGTNLCSFVESCLPQKIDEILEPILTGYHHEGGEGADQLMVGIRSCAMQLVTLGLKCSEMTPRDRATTEDAYAETLSIREEFLALCRFQNSEEQGSRRSSRFIWIAGVRCSSTWISSFD